MLKSKSYMEDMTKTIGDNQGRIGFLESLNKQLEGTVQVKHQQTEEVALLLCVLLFSFLFFVLLVFNRQMFIIIQISYTTNSDFLIG